MHHHRHARSASESATRPSRASSSQDAAPAAHKGRNDPRPRPNRSAQEHSNRSRLETLLDPTLRDVGRRSARTPWITPSSSRSGRPRDQEHPLHDCIAGDPSPRPATYLPPSSTARSLARTSAIVDGASQFAVDPAPMIQLHLLVPYASWDLAGRACLKQRSRPLTEIIAGVFSNAARSVRCAVAATDPAHNNNH